MLMTPNNKIEKNNIKSKLDNLSLIENGEYKEFLVYNIIYPHLFYLNN